MSFSFTVCSYQVVLADEAQSQGMLLDGLPFQGQVYAAMPKRASNSIERRDLRREPIEVRKATLASILRKARYGVRLNEHLEHDCGLQHACKMGLEGIVSSGWGRAIDLADRRTG